MSPRYWAIILMPLAILPMSDKANMVETLNLVLLIMALVCLFLAALGVIAPRINLMAMGLAIWLLAELLRRP